MNPYRLIIKREIRSRRKTELFRHVTITADMLERFWSKVDRSAGPDGCWLWTASSLPSGYGQFMVRHGMRPEKAHRFAYRAARGYIPRRGVVRHSCDNPPCVNPAHLDLGDQSDNALDWWHRGRFAGSVPA